MVVQGLSGERALTDTSAGVLDLSRPPIIAVIIPTYGHPVLLSEAIESVLAQECSVPIGIVIVSDGCKLPETDLMASAYVLGHSHVTYLRKSNGGPSSARNYGIDFVLRSWPSVEAFYFLDADNRLTPAALTDAYAVLQSNDKVGWVYPSIDSFGIVWAANYAIPYSPLLHIVHDNMCDTGSLVRRELLSSGVRFDEDARSGYEDWDFWLQCLERGYVGKQHPFGFYYRQRPESRFREMNRQRSAVMDHLRQRHWSLAAPKNLLHWEHETNPRYLWFTPGTNGGAEFTDPANHRPLQTSRIVEQFYAALLQPDEYLLWPYFVFGDISVLESLKHARIIHNVFQLLERECAESNFVALTLSVSASDIRLTLGEPQDRTSLHRRAVIWMCRGDQMVEIVRDQGTSWIGSLATSYPEPKLTELNVAIPQDKPLARDERATQALMNLFWRLRSDPYRSVRGQRWTWRPKQFPDRRDYYQHVCRYLGTEQLMPRLGASLDIGVIVPIASFGGAEKVAYAMARHLRELGARTHLFVVGAPSYKFIDEYVTAFDTINFLADRAFPLWGGPLTVMGQESFLPGAAELNTGRIAGMLANLDLVVNCHSAPMHAIMGTLRSQYRIKTATYLHVFDSSPVRRPVGHPYLAVAFEHAYDLILTCSRQLAEQVHSLGIPAEKIIPIQNAAGFTADAEVRRRQRIERAKPRGSRRLRVLYLGRLDPQKGIERLLLALRRGFAERLPIEVRVVGAGLLTSEEGFEGALRKLGVSVEPAVYANEDLARLYSWADVLILPSRWEGAPLVIAECQQFGCIPICTRVGAVEELVDHDIDGLLVADADDYNTAGEILRCVTGIVTDDDRRSRLALAGIARSNENAWEVNFLPLSAWIKANFGNLKAVSE